MKIIKIISKIITWIVFAPFLLMVSSNIFAQSLIKEKVIKEPTLIEDVFHEGFKENINVSSGVVVGLVMGSPKGIESIRHIIMDKSGWPEATTFCLRSSSSDGLFWAENSYKTDKSSFWKITPISKKFSSQLKSYGNENIVAKISLSNSANSKVCSQRDTVFAPVTGSSANSDIKIYINSSNRYTFAELWEMDNKEANEPLQELLCNQAITSGASIYDYVCNLDTDELNFSGIAELRLFFDTPFGTQQWNEKIAIPQKDISDE